MSPFKSYSLTAVFVLVATSATFALAEPKPAAKPAPTKASAAAPASAGAAAPAKGDDAASCAMCGKGGPGAGHGCPVHELAKIADAKVAETATGATVTFTAKSAADAKKVQELAQRIGAMTAGGSCPMMQGGMCPECAKMHGEGHDCSKMHGEGHDCPMMHGKGHEGGPMHHGEGHGPKGPHAH